MLQVTKSEGSATGGDQESLAEDLLKRFSDTKPEIKKEPVYSKQILDLDKQTDRLTDKFYRELNRWCLSISRSQNKHFHISQRWQLAELLIGNFL